MTTRDEFRAALAEAGTRRALGVDVTDAQALQILADDASLDRWYQWWSARPVGANIRTASLGAEFPAEVSGAAVPHYSHQTPVPFGQIASADSSMPSVPILWGVLGIAAVPVAFLIYTIVMAIVPLTSSDFVGPVGLLLCLAVTTAGLVFSIRSVRIARRTDALARRRGAAIGLGVTGIVLCSLAMIFWLVLIAGVVVFLSMFG